LNQRWYYVTWADGLEGEVRPMGREGYFLCEDGAGQQPADAIREFRQWFGRFCDLPLFPVGRRCEATEATGDTALQQSAATVQRTGQESVPGRKGKRINLQMLQMIQRKPESANWSAQKWADALGCSKSTVGAT